MPLAEAELTGLARAVRVVRAQPPLAACEPGRHGPGCAEAQARLRNPFAIQEDPGAFQTTGGTGLMTRGGRPVRVRHGVGSELP